MIESNIIEWLDFGDSTQIIDIYTKRNRINFFKFFKALINNKNFPIIVYIILIIIFFIQIWTMCLINVSFEKEFLLDILNYLKNITVLYEVITSAISYKNMLIILFVLIIFDFLLGLIIFLLNNKSNVSYLCIIINLLNIIIFYYLIGPAVEIALTSIWCENKSHKYLRITCFNNSIHLIYTIFSFIMLLLYIFLTFIYCFYCNEIDIIITNSRENISRLDCNYEIYCLISKICIFIFGFFFFKMDYEEDEHLYIKIIYEVFIFLICLIMSLYSYKNVYFYNYIINNVNHFGWYFSTWFSLGIILKTIFNLSGISNFIIVGCVMITFTLNKGFILKENILLTEDNVFEFKNINEIEVYKNILLSKLSDKNNSKSKIFVFGIIKKFEEFAFSNPEISYQYHKLLNDENLNKKYNKEDSLPIITIIYILYIFYYEKFSNKEEVVFHMCYFLINKLKNISYAMLLCSRLKSKGHKSLYYKYLLTEDIKQYLIFKLNKKSNKESIKHVQLSSVILYYLYIDLFKMKIYDAVCNQIDYFDLLKNNITTNKTAENFMKTGENIFKTGNDITTIWGKLVKLNPFNDECFKDYMLYLNSIVQNDVIARDESKKYQSLKNRKYQEKYNIYHSLFINDVSSVLLIDGYLANGKILYASQNFAFLFRYNGKEVLSLTVEDLLPNVVQTFHRELIEKAIKYSNVKYIFKESIDSLLRNKNGGLFNIKLFVKPVPNLFYGLIYFTYIQKLHEQNFNILLDKELKINGFTELDEKGSELTINNGINLSQNILGYHIGSILPDIFSLLEFKDDEFCITKTDCELKGILYAADKVRDLKNKIDIILEKIKGKNNNNYELEEDPRNIKTEINNLISEYNEQKIKSTNIFYNIKLYTFLDGKYKYYRLFLNNLVVQRNGTPCNNRNAEILKRRKDISDNIFKKNDSKNSKESKRKIQLKITEKLDEAQVNKNANISLKSVKSEDGQNFNEKNIEKKEDKKNEEGKNNNNNNEDKDKDKDKDKEKDKDNFIKEEENKNNNNAKEENKFKQFEIRHINSTTSSYNYRSFINLKGYNKVKNNIINHKETFPLKIMKYLCYIFPVVTILLMIFDVSQQIESFRKLSQYLSHNLFFDDIKINVGVLYIISVNVRWLSHSLYMGSHTHFNEEWSTFYKNLLESHIDIIKKIKTDLSYIEEFPDIINNKYQVELFFYKVKYPKVYSFNFNNFLYYMINNEIKLLDKFDDFVDNSCKEIPKESDINKINLKNLIEQSYNFYTLNLSLYTIEDIKKNNKDNKYFYYFPSSLLISGIIILCLILFFIYYIISLFNIEIYFLDKLINFNSTNFDNYLKKLDEIKKKLRNDTTEEEEKVDDIELKDDEEGEGNDVIEEKNSNKISRKIKTIERDKNKKNKIQQHRRNKLKLMTTFFRVNTLFFQFKIILILSSSLTYYILSIFIKSSKKNSIINFFELNEALNYVFKNSYDIFISLERKLDIYERSLINCSTIGNFTEMIFPQIGEIDTPKFGNLIMEIIGNSDLNEETINNFSKVFQNNACEILIQYSNEMEYCRNFWSGVLVKGLEQAIIQMDIIIGTVIDELKSLNDKNNITLLRLMTESSYIQYVQFNAFYLYRAYLNKFEIFDEFNNQKLNGIIKGLKILFLFYIIISLVLFTLLIYFVYSYNSLFNSFLNFVGIFPTKYIFEDELFYNEIIKFGDKYF